MKLFSSQSLYNRPLHSHCFRCCGCEQNETDEVPTPHITCISLGRLSEGTKGNSIPDTQSFGEHSGEKGEQSQAIFPLVLLPACFSHWASPLPGNMGPFHTDLQPQSVLLQYPESALILGTQDGCYEGVLSLGWDLGSLSSCTCECFAPFHLNSSCLECAV